MTPKDFIEYRDHLRKHIAILNEDIAEVYQDAESCPPPANLRPATATDIVAGAIIWYPKYADNDSCWCAQ